jgi:succinyl-diaminopimelate desuccinylase
LREAAGNAVRYTLEVDPTNALAFVTEPDAFVGFIGEAIEAETGIRPKLSTTGGTSDARFIKSYCPVVEFGLVGQTMHQVDERVAVADLDGLTAIYRRAIEAYFSNGAAAFAS